MAMSDESIQSRSRTIRLLISKRRSQNMPVERKPVFVVQLSPPFLREFFVKWAYGSGNGNGNASYIVHFLYTVYASNVFLQ